MRVRLWILTWLLGLAFVSSSFAQGSVSPGEILGKWTATEKHPSGAVIASTVEFARNMKFTSVTTANGAPVLQASGTWKLTGTSLEYLYEESSHPSIPKGFVDTDEVKTVSAQEITLVSKLSGKTHTFRRVK